MAYPYIPPPSTKQMINDKAQELVDFVTKKAPKATVKIEVKYSSSQVCCWELSK